MKSELLKETWAGAGLRDAALGSSAVAPMRLTVQPSTDSTYSEQSAVLPMHLAGRPSAE